MFNFLKNLFSKPPPPSHILEMRETLFGDMPWEMFPPPGGAGDPADPANPWPYFVRARDFAQERNNQAAIVELRSILTLADLESRVILQAWHFLRSLGVMPEGDEAKRVYGVVIEYAFGNSFDLLAAYADHRARYWNHGGAGIIWETDDPGIDADIDKLIAAGQNLAQMIGPWEGPRRGPVAGNILRVNLLTPIGLHFGEGPAGIVSRDRMAAPTFTAATKLMMDLMSIHKAHKGTGGH